jgi:hypothetical protein
MTRRILQGSQPVVQSRAGNSVPKGSPTTRAQLESRLRRKRSTGYLEAIRRLDAGTHVADREALKSLLEGISREFPDLSLDQRPLGIVSTCYLGPPYQVHVCDLGGEIIEHYETFRPMPAPFEGARSLALHPSYAFVEVFADGCRAVSPDGAVAWIGGSA